jgi:serine phosphatase RsbU (regulator of sigma subunit)
VEFGASTNSDHLQDAFQDSLELPIIPESEEIMRLIGILMFWAWTLTSTAAAQETHDGVLRIGAVTREINLRSLLRKVKDDVSAAQIESFRADPSTLLTLEPDQSWTAFRGRRKTTLFRLEIDNEAGGVQKMTLANDFPSYDSWLFLPHTAQIDFAGGHLAFGLGDRPLPRYAAFDVELPPGRSQLFVAQPSGAFGSPHTWNLWPTPRYHRIAKLKEIAQVTLMLVIAVLLALTAIVAAFLGMKRYICSVLAILVVAVLLSSQLGNFSLLSADLVLAQPAIVSVLVALAIALFSMSDIYFYGIDRQEHPRIWWLLFANAVAQVILTAVLAPFTEGFSLACGMVWLFGLAVATGSLTVIHLVKGDRQAIFFTFASTPLIATTIVKVGSYFGLNAPHWWETEATLASLSFLLFSVALVTSRKIYGEKTERSRLKESLMMGRSVQELLLPQKISRGSDGVSYDFVYVPYEGLMSGDWINRWKTSDGGQHFLIGDVTGKGPAAALAVACIAMSVSKCSSRDSGMVECLRTINADLLANFKGSGTSTVSGLSIFPDATMILYNGGGLGWYHYRKGNVRHILDSGDLLGMKRDVEFRPSTEALAPGDAVLTFTDGLAPNGVKLKRIVGSFFKDAAGGCDLKVLLSAAKQAHAASRVVVDDDTTAVLIHRAAA